MTIQFRSAHRGLSRLIFTSAIFLALGIGGCTVAPLAGQDSASVQRELGPPSTRSRLPGGDRWIYTRAFAQENLTVEFDTAGKVIRSYNGLSDQNFMQIQPGSWRRDDVLTAFGQPNERGGVGWGEHRFEVWSYRYKQSGIAPMLLGVHFDAKGVVAKFYAYPDPAFERNDKSRN